MLLEDILDSLPPLNTMVSSLLTELDSDDCSAENVEKLILQDPVLSARTLHMANSSFYGFSRNIVTLKQAYIILGRNTLRNLVCTISLLDQFNQTNAKNDFLNDVWMHSLYSACLISTLDEDKFEVESLFLVALFQYIGLVALGLYEPKLQVTLSQKGLLNKTLMDQEVTNIAGVPVSQLSKDILEHWKFPKNICEQVGSLNSYSSSNSPVQVCSVIVSAFGYRPANWIIEEAINDTDFQKVFCNNKELKKSIKQSDDMFLSILSLIYS